MIARPALASAVPLAPPSGARLIAIDMARSLALLGMVVFHFARDLEFFGVVAAGATLSGGWSVLARVTAGSFLFLSGVSLVLAHRPGFRARAFLRRLGTIAAAALLVTLATYLAEPSRYVYFGILHAIALASVVCLPFVWLPAWSSALAAAAVWIVSASYGRSLLDAPWAAFTGLGTMVRPSLDLLPAFPWLAPCLLGVSLASAVDLRPRTGGARNDAAWAAFLCRPGRHSLAIYLIHQPILLALIWLALEAGR